MKKTFRWASILIPIVVLIAGIGLWKYVNLKIRNSEPVKVYKSTPLQQSNLPTDVNTPKVETENRKDNSDVEIEPGKTLQHIEKVTSPEETDNTSNTSNEAMLSDIGKTTDLPPEASAALKEYEEAQSEYLGAQNQLKDALNIRPFDFKSIQSANKSIENAKERRLDALEKLAVFVDDAFYELVDTLEREKEVDKLLAERTADSDKHEIPQGLTNLFKILDTMSPEERVSALREYLIQDSQ